jgi:hypothetical protein
LEAELCLVAAWFIRRYVPFRVWITRLGVPGTETAVVPLPRNQEARVLDIRSAIYRSGYVSGALRNCLVLSIAAKLMLRRRRIPSTLYFAAITRHEGDYFYLGSHSWVRCGTITIGSLSPQLKQILSIGDVR